MGTLVNYYLNISALYLIEFTKSIQLNAIDSLLRNRFRKMIKKTAIVPFSETCLSG